MLHDAFLFAQLLDGAAFVVEQTRLVYWLA
jgi:hypothetical protein